ncbi:Hypothetical predicted protein [Cloeon dipterum]|uniref:Uncharacterized protein n=1 Tax=Cloeon dipterum TaxID=197152 RepID=A0A8S1DM11_9INSE|nr:Hypothetical predicted protein [Cloeon dipterum]
MVNSDNDDKGESNDRKRRMDESPESDEIEEKIPRVESDSPSSLPKTDEIQKEKSLADKLEYVENNKGNIPALLFAAKYTDVDVCRKLVDDGADVNERDENGNDVYHCAALNRNNCDIELLDFFLKCKAEMKRLNVDEDDAVLVAFYHSKFKFAKKLFDVYKSNESFLANVAFSNSEKIKSAYYQDPSVVKVTGKEEFDLQILKRMALCQDLKTFKWILKIACDNGVDLSKNKELQLGLLMDAAQNEDESERIFKFLLYSYGNDLTSQDLMSIIIDDFLLRENLKCIELLVNNRADLNECIFQEEETTLLEYCVENNSLNSAKFVYGKKKKKINLRVLICAARYASVEMCEWLLELPMDFNLYDNGGRLFEEVLSNIGHGAKIIRRMKPILRAIVNEPMGNYYPQLYPLHLAMQNENLEAASALLEIGASLKVKFNVTINLLIYCLGINFLEGAKFVYSIDKSQTMGRKFMGIAMMLAKKHGNQEMAQWLDEVQH